LFVTSSPAFAQLDPLLFLKAQQPPNVILAVDTATRMQNDADGTYYDPGTYTSTLAGMVYESAMGLQLGEANPNYRRKYFGLTPLNTNPNNDKYSATSIEAMGDQEPGYATFFEPTKLTIARRALAQAIADSIFSARFGLIKTRQAPTYPVVPAAGNENPVFVSSGPQSSTGDMNTGRWKITRPLVTATNNSQTASGSIFPADGTNANASVATQLQKDFWNGAVNPLLPAGRDDANTLDTPVGLMLTDAKAEATRLIAADTTGCRNTIVVLVVGGGEGSNNTNLASKASEFLNVSGRRVPIYVVAIAPETDAERDELRQVAEASGGQFFEITKAMIESASGRGPVPEIVRAVNLAVQHGFVSSTTFNVAPTTEFPYGLSQEFQVTSPIVGTVNLKGAERFNPITGARETLPDSETEIFKGTSTELIPQRSNVLVTSALGLPGFYGQLRALRVYRPVLDTAKSAGYRFTQDGSRLWTASVPAAASRNIYTVLPGSSTAVKFDASNVVAISPYLRVADPDVLIEWIRNQPLGAVVGSTPAFLEPPSLDPPPDGDYPEFVDENKGRRALIFVGANDGMLHALDARTGVEAWAFIPYNLLPKLRALRSGQSLDAFKYFVDSSPKVADVKIGGVWKTYLFVGQGPGGTYYNTFDVTLPGIADTVSATSTSTDQLISYFSNPSRIEWKWSFPRNSEFDHLGLEATPYGDIAATASAVEKTVGETWSDPAIGQIVSETGPYTMIVGSGFLKRSVELQSNRGGARAGRSFYVIDVETGDVLASRDVGADTAGEEDDDCRSANDCRRIKNALQMDPVATGPSDSRFVNQAYIGDLDGRVWRFEFQFSGTTVSMPAPVNLYGAGASHPLFASMAYVDVLGKKYLFVGTGSDLLPSNSVNQSYSLLILLDNGSSATKTGEILLDLTDGVSPDEKVTAFPAVAGEIVFFSTTTINPLAPCAPFTANLYALTFDGGPAYDTNGDGTVTRTSSGGGNPKNPPTTGDSTKVMAVAGARASAPFIVDQHLVFATGDKLEMFGDPDDFNNGVGQAGISILSWRLVK
jgi:hypothetical protein